MDDLGFTERLHVAGRFSIADIFPKSKNRCGIYLLEFADGLCYIGQAVNVVRRFAQHRKLYENIAYLRFRPVKQKELNLIEPQLIHQAESAGMALTNKVYVSQVQGETDLDFLVSPEEQESWLQDASVSNRYTERVKIDLEEKYRTRHKYQFQRFKERKDFDDVLIALKDYISECILAPRCTEFSFWSVSCMPSTNASTWPRLTVINLNRMEVFVIGHYKNEPGHLWSFINISQEYFFENYTEDSFQEKYPNTEIEFTGYVAAGYDQMHISIDGIDQLYEILEDDAILEAASILNLRLMQKGGNIYANSHCFELADLLI